MAVTTVVYTYGAGSAPNRQVEFIRGGNPQAFYARFKVLGTQSQIGVIFADEIEVEMESTTSKMRNLISGRQNQQNQLLSSFLPTQQDQIVQSINADPSVTGGRWIQVRNGPNGVNNHETVVHLTITNPT